MNTAAETEHETEPELEQELKKPDIGPDEASKAFQTAVEAIDLSLKGTLPLGIDHIEVHMQIKGALLTLSAVLEQHFGTKPVTQTVEDTVNSSSSSPSSRPSLGA